MDQQQPGMNFSVSEGSQGVIVDTSAFADQGATFALETEGTIGSLVADPDGTVRYSPNGQFESLAADATGHDSFTLSVTSNGTTTDYVYDVTVQGMNDAPTVVVAPDDQYAKTGESWSFTVPPELFRDADGDALSISVTSQDGTALPDWLTFDPATSSFTGTPPDGVTGPVGLAIVAIDSGGLTAMADLTLQVTSGPEVLHALQPQNGLEDQYYFYQIPTNTFRDQVDPLTYSATLGNGQPLPSWLTFDPQALTLSGQPPQDYSGTVKIAISASDGATAAVSKFVLTLDNVPDAPSELDLTTHNVLESAPIGSAVGVLSTADADLGDTFSYSLINDDHGAFALDGDALVVNGYLDSHIAGGVQHVVVRSTDSTGNSIDHDFAIQVQSSQGELFANNTPTRQIWVATNGVDQDGGGSADSPFATIQYAIDHATPGTAIMVHAGTYAEAIKIDVSGTPDAPIWLESADGVGAAEIKPVGQAEVNAIEGQGMQNIVIDGFKITGTDTIGTYGFNLVSKNNGAKNSFTEGWAGGLVANVLIKNNIITNWGIDDVHIANSFNLQIINNTVSGGHEQGIDIITSRRLLIADNNVSNITAKPEWKGLDSRDYVGDSGITVKGSASEVSIINNFIGDNKGSGIKIGAPTALTFIPIAAGLDSDGTHYVPYEAKDVLVEGNTILDSPASAIAIRGSINVTVDQNLITKINVSDNDREVSNVVYGGGEKYLIDGIHIPSDNLTFENNVYTAGALYNSATTTAHVADSRNTVYDPNASYDPSTNAWINGTSVGATSTTLSVTGTAGADMLHGDAGGVPSNDYITGKAGADAMYGGQGDDTYIFDQLGDTATEYANGGTDTVVLTKDASKYKMPEPTTDSGGYIENVIVGRSLDTSVYGNSLNNKIVGGDHNDNLQGNLGNDALYGGNGDDALNGGPGHDLLYGGAGADHLFGMDGDDVLDGGAGLDSLRGGDGNDTLISNDTDSGLDGGGGIDLAEIDRSTSPLNYVFDISYFGHGEATSKNDREIILADGTRLRNIEKIDIATGDGADHITGGYYDDHISTGAGDDYINGNDGNDLLRAGAGTDIVYGGAGDDTIDGGLGADFVHGDAGNDSITSHEADYVLDGGDGIDTLTLLRDDDIVGYTIDIGAVARNPDTYYTLTDGTSIRGFETLVFDGGSGNDYVVGGANNDNVSGGHGSDTLYGGDGNDKLQGGGESDSLHGGHGDDVLSGGPGADDLWGDAGSDTFKFAAGSGDGDVIHDFEGAGKKGGDMLSFNDFGLGATLTYDAGTQLWTAASADGSLHSSFTIVGVTHLTHADYMFS